MRSLTFAKDFNNSKLFFSNSELSKILSLYSIGVSQGNWRDYAIDYKINEANFFMFKHSLAYPDCILTKSFRTKKNSFIYKLDMGNKNRNKFNKIDDLLIILKRKNFRLVKM